MSNRPRARGLFGRAVSVSVGLSALAAALALVSPTLFVPSTSRAMFNARVVSVRAPYPGTVADVSVRPGDEVTAGQVLLRVEHPHPDARPLAKLRAAAGAQEERVAGLTAQRDRLAALRDELGQSLKQYRSAYTDRTEHKLAEARAAYDEARAKRAFAEAQAARRERLATVGSGGAEEKQQWEAQVSQDRAAEEQARAVVRQHEVELAALRQGVFLGSRDGSHGLPYQRQRLDELAVLLAEVEANLSAARAELYQTHRQIQVEAELLAAHAAQEVKAPVSGLVHRRLVDPGTHTDAKGELLQLVDPRQVFVEAVVGRRDFQALRPGDAARVRLDGGWGRLPGRVAYKRGLWAGQPDGTFAATLPPVGKDGDYRVVVALDRLPPQAGPGNLYLAGTRVEVTFPRGAARVWEDLTGE